MKKNNFWEVVIRVAIAALTAALTALGTTGENGGSGKSARAPLFYLLRIATQLLF